MFRLREGTQGLTPKSQPLCHQHSTPQSTGHSTWLLGLWEQQWHQSCKFSPSSCSQKHWLLEARPAPSSAPSPAWHGSQNLWVLPEALKKIEMAASSRRGGQVTASQTQGAASSQPFNLGAESGVCLRGRFLPGPGKSWTKAGWFTFKVLGPEEENASPMLHTEPALHSRLLGHRARATDTGALGASSPAHTRVSFCTSRSAG